VDYYCNPQFIWCGWTMNSPHPLAYTRCMPARCRGLIK
jgi:hypothetical protein